MQRMCGILGGNVQTWDYEKGINSIIHRGPDGYKIDRHVDFTLAFARLSIRDLSESAMQPMSNAENNVHIVYNGEIYGYEDLKRQLEKKYEFHTRSDTEVVLNAYLEYGPAFIDKIDGIFAMAIYDERIRKIFLFRDRAGVKPLYYLCRGKQFGFASELKALKGAVNDFSFEIDYTAVYDYLFYQYIPAPKSVYRSVYKLQPATMLVYDVLGKKIVSEEKYWRLHVNGSVDRRRSSEDISGELRTLIGKTVRNQLEADVPVGTFLSGGIDSSIITYEAACLDPQIKAFCIGFQEKEYDESDIAERFCREKNIEIRKKKLGIADISRLRDRIRNWYDEPFADTSAYPSYLVSEFAKHDVTVVLTGDGGDELFGGYGRYTVFNNRYREIGGSIAQEERLKYERAQIRQGMGVADAECYKEYARQWGIPPEYDPYERLYQYDCSELPPFTRMRYLDFNTYLPDAVLTKMDRVSMTVSLEARVPFLSREVMEYAFSLSQEECNGANGLKACLKDAYDGVVPDEILYGQKKGFGIPQSYLWREKKAESLYAGILIEHWKDLIKEDRKETELYKKAKRLEVQCNLLNQWITLSESNITLEKILKRKKYRSVAIYGLADIGRHVYRALENSDIKICYGVDRWRSGQYEKIMVKKPEDDLERVDVMIVTALMDYEAIKSSMETKLDFPIVSLEEILYEFV